MKSVSVFSYGTSEHALGHLRVCEPLKRCGIRVHWHHPVEDFSADSDLLIIQRDFPRDLKKYEKIVRQANLSRIPIIFEIDDLLWELPLDHPDRTNRHYLDALWPMLLAAQQADAIIVTTPKLKGFMQQLNSKVYVLPNYLDDNLWNFRDPLQENEVVRVGYMGGSSHQPDIQMILPALKEILHRYSSRVRLIFWGLEPPQEILDMSSVKWHPLDLQNYSLFAENFRKQNMDIFLAPLKASAFNRCKSPIKYFECTTLGSAGVCSNIDPYRRVIEHGETGFLAESIEDWIKYLGALIENRDLRNQISRKAQENIRSKWLLSGHYQEWTDIYQLVIDQYQPRDQSKLFEIAATIQEQWNLTSQFERDNLVNRISELEIQQNLDKYGIFGKVKQVYMKLHKFLLGDSKE